jgi:hypothetical protein
LSNAQGDSDRLMGEPENHLSYPAYLQTSCLQTDSAGARLRSSVPFIKSAEEPLFK